MASDLTILALAERLAAHAATRQRLVAENVANADTPGWKARDLPPFAEILAAAPPPRLGDGRSRPGHLDLSEGLPPGATPQEIAAPGATNPNGNTVSLEDQMLRSAELGLQHELALGIWQAATRLLRHGLAR